MTCGRLQVPRVLAAVLCLTLATCQGRTDPGEVTGEPVVLRASMKDVIEPQSLAVLTALIAALDQSGRDVDPTRLTDADWEMMETAATVLRDEFAMLRDRPIQVVAAPGDTLFQQDREGMARPPEVQARIDADPEGFSAMADALRARAEEWLTASGARDAQAMWRVALDLDPSCTACHEVFWYGEAEHADQDDHDHEDEP